MECITKTIKSKPITQKSQIWNYLEKGNSITKMQAIHMFGIMNLSEYIRQFRHEDGKNISTRFITNSSGRGHFAVYKLEE